MIKSCKFLTGLGLVYSMLAPGSVVAQTVSEPTPRHVFVSFITGVPPQDVRFKTEVGLELEPKPVEVAPSPVQNVLPPVSQALPLQPSLEPIAPVVPEVINEYVELAAPELDHEGIARASASARTEIQPFFVNARQYLEARGDGALDQIILEYEVTPINKVLGLSANSKKVRLVVGPDFVAVTRESKTRIFDFKMRRLLTIRPGEASLVFDNMSLYPIALNTIETVKSVTKNGSISEIQVGPDQTLDAFWMEASLGWSARQTVDNLNVSYVDDLFVAEYAGEVATQMTMNGPVLISEALRSSLFAFLHHDVPIHPVVLKDLGLPLSVPSRLETLSFSPNYPNGLKTVWVLKKSETVSQPFPLLKNNQPVVSEGKGAPIEFVIYNHMQALEKPNIRTNDDLRQAVFDARTTGKNLEAWLNAKELASRLGGCQEDPALLCQDISDLEADAAPKRALGRLVWATQEHDVASIRVTAFDVLMEQVRDGNAPAFLVKRAGKMRARLKSKDLKVEKLKFVRADRLLEEALVKNPTDPETYRILSQVYAAQRRYVESWNLQDAMRRLPNVDKALVEPITRVEKSLIDQAPAFFIPEIP